jgi:dienelactone hydrolase
MIVIGFCVGGGLMLYSRTTVKVRELNVAGLRISPYGIRF